MTMETKTIGFEIADKGKKYDYPDRENWKEAMQKLANGEIIHITEDFFDYFLEVLPPIHMRKLVKLSNGDEVTACFGFAEGAEPIIAFMKYGLDFYAGQTDKINGERID